MQKILITGFGFMGSLHAPVYPLLRHAKLVAMDAIFALESRSAS